MAKKATGGKPAGKKQEKPSTDENKDLQGLDAGSQDAGSEGADEDLEDQDLEDQDETEEQEEAAEAKPFAYLVNLHQKNVIVVPSDVKGGASHIIKGGINTVPANIWEKVVAHPVHEAKIADGRMEVVAPILPGSDTVSELIKLLPAQCKSVIEGLTDEKTIVDWQLKEGRAPILKMLEKQLERLKKEVTIKK